MPPMPHHPRHTTLHHPCHATPRHPTPPTPRHANHTTHTTHATPHHSSHATPPTVGHATPHHSHLVTHATPLLPRHATHTTHTTYTTPRQPRHATHADYVTHAAHATLHPTLRYLPYSSRHRPSYTPPAWRVATYFTLSETSLTISSSTPLSFQVDQYLKRNNVVLSCFDPPSRNWCWFCRGTDLQKKPKSKEIPDPVADLEKRKDDRMKTLRNENVDLELNPFAPNLEKDVTAARMWWSALRAKYGDLRHPPHSTRPHRVRPRSLHNSMHCPMLPPPLSRV